MLYTIHIYFLMRKLYLITFHISKHLCHFDMYPNIATNMWNYMVIMSFGWFLLTQIHGIGNIVLDFSVWCQFLIPIYIHSLPLPSAYIYIFFFGGGSEIHKYMAMKIVRIYKIDIYIQAHNTLLLNWLFFKLSSKSLLKKNKKNYIFSNNYLHNFFLICFRRFKLLSGVTSFQLEVVF